MKHSLLILSLPFLAACSGTSEFTSYLSPYKIDVRQGNFVTQEMVTQLKPGQTKDQVRFILGSPLVTDVFHADRWDYIYRFKPGRGEVQERRLTVFFDKNLLSRVTGDVVANNATGDSPQHTNRIIEIDKAGATDLKSGVTVTPVVRE